MMKYLNNNISICNLQLNRKFFFFLHQCSTCLAYEENLSGSLFCDLIFSVGKYYILRKKLSVECTKKAKDRKSSFIPNFALSILW